MRCGIHAARGEIVAHRLRTTRTERDVVLARAALVGMAFDGESVLAIRLAATAPASPASHGLRLSSVDRFEEHPIADIDDEILLAAGRVPRRWRRGRIGRVRTACRRERQGEDAGELRTADSRANNFVIPVPPFLASLPAMPQASSCVVKPRLLTRLLECCPEPTNARKARNPSSCLIGGECGTIGADPLL